MWKVLSYLGSFRQHTTFIMFLAFILNTALTSFLTTSSPCHIVGRIDADHVVNREASVLDIVAQVTSKCNSATDFGFELTSEV